MDTIKDLAIAKLKAFCVYRERCHQEVRSKLLAEKVYGDELEEIMGILIQENFLNEERFAVSYALGKFRQNKWGRNKIMNEIAKFNVSSYCKNKGLAAIDEDEYREMIVLLWDKKYATFKNEQDYIKKQKTLKYLMGKGFEYEIIKEFT